MADIYLECDTCMGKRFKNKVLEIRINKKNIYDILKMTIEEALTFLVFLNLFKIN